MVLGKLSSQGKARQGGAVANIGDYETTYANFEWGTPERYNFGRDVVDALPEDQSAMIWLGKGGARRRLTFGDFSRLSNRFAGAMRDLGVERGDRVMVTLGKVPEWHATLLGLLKLGAIAIPSSPMLRANDLKFRTEHSGAKSGRAGTPTECLWTPPPRASPPRTPPRKKGPFFCTPPGRRSIQRAPCTPTATRTQRGCRPGTGWISRRTTGFGVPPRAAGPRPCGTSFWGPGVGAWRCSCTSRPSIPWSA